MLGWRQSIKCTKQPLSVGKCWLNTGIHMDTGDLFKKLNHNCIIISCWDILLFKQLHKTYNNAACWRSMAPHLGRFRESIKIQPRSEMVLINAPSPLLPLGVLNKRPGRLLGRLRYMNSNISLVLNRQSELELSSKVWNSYTTTINGHTLYSIMCETHDCAFL